MRDFPGIDSNTITPEAIWSLSEELRSTAEETRNSGSPVELALLTGIANLAITYIVSCADTLREARWAGDEQQLKAAATDFLITWTIINQVGRGAFAEDDEAIAYIDQMNASGRHFYELAESIAYGKEN